MKRVLAVLFLAVFVSAAFPAGTQVIGGDAAVKAARAQADGIVTEIGTDNYKGRFVYDVKILDSSGVFHTIAVSGTDGAIVRHTIKNQSKGSYNLLKLVNITHKQVAAGAEATVPGSIVYDSGLHAKKGKSIFELKLVDDKGYVYEAAIDAMTGTLISMEKDDRFLSYPDVTKDAAEKAALAKISGTILYTRLDKETGTFYYYVNIVSGGTLYKVKVDGHNGVVVGKTP